MGRSAKYPGINKAYTTTGVVIPSGSTANRPSVAANGTFRYNTDTLKFELYQDGAWINPASRGYVPILKDSFTGDGSTIEFTLTNCAGKVNNENGVHVYVNNVHQNPGTAYTYAANKITFITIPQPAATIEVLAGFDSTDI